MARPLVLKILTDSFRHTQVGMRAPYKRRWLGTGVV